MNLVTFDLEPEVEEGVGPMTLSCHQMINCFWRDASHGTGRLGYCEIFSLSFSHPGVTLFFPHDDCLSLTLIFGVIDFFRLTPGGRRPIYTKWVSPH